MINTSLLEKYNIPGPRYTSYPPANLFKNTFNSKDYKKAVVESNEVGEKNMSIYIHIPFCHNLCHFCGCTTEIRPAKSRIEEYLDTLELEIRSIAALLDKEREVIQIHWGGGTPHAIADKGIVRVMDLLREVFTISPTAEIAMECHPGFTDDAFFHLLKAQGFNRISLGVQDYSPSVLKAINRRAPKQPLKETVDLLKSLDIRVNFDLVYGLPTQSKDDFDYTIQQTILAKPHRIATFSYAHVPWVKKAQEILDKYHRIEGAEKWSMLYSAYSQLKEATYIPIGMDHFALADDSLVEAQEKHSLHRNFQGYTAYPGQVYAFGSSGISQLQNGFFQNVKDPKEYVKRMQEDTLTERGYLLNEEEQVIGQTISKIMCNTQIDISPLLEMHQVDFSELERDGMLKYESPLLQITEQGRFFVRNIAMKCDPFLNTKNSYSKTI